MAKAKEEVPAVVKNMESLLRKALAEAPTVQEVLGHPEHYEKWYKDSREVLNA